MTRLIDADKLREKLIIDYEVRETYFGERLLEVIDNAPTIYPICEDKACKYRANERTKGEWILVNERLPEKTGYYLVTRKGFSIKNHVKRVGYDANTKRWSEGSIIAWQSLPEPYKKGGAE